LNIVIVRYEKSLCLVWLFGVDASRHTGTRTCVRRAGARRFWGCENHVKQKEHGMGDPYKDAAIDLGNEEVTLAVQDCIGALLDRVEEIEQEKIPVAASDAGAGAGADADAVKSLAAMLEELRSITAQGDPEPEGAQREMPALDVAASLAALLDELFVIAAQRGPDGAPDATPAATWHGVNVSGVAADFGEVGTAMAKGLSRAASVASSTVSSVASVADFFTSFGGLGSSRASADAGDIASGTQAPPAAGRGRAAAVGDAETNSRTGSLSVGVRGAVVSAQDGASAASHIESNDGATDSNGPSDSSDISENYSDEWTQWRLASLTLLREMVTSAVTGAAGGAVNQWIKHTTGVAALNVSATAAQAFYAGYAAGMVISERRGDALADQRAAGVTLGLTYCLMSLIPAMLAGEGATLGYNVYRLLRSLVSRSLDSTTNAVSTVAVEARIYVGIGVTGVLSAEAKRQAKSAFGAMVEGSPLEHFWVNTGNAAIDAAIDNTVPMLYYAFSKGIAALRGAVPAFEPFAKYGLDIGTYFVTQADPAWPAFGDVVEDGFVGAGIDAFGDSMSDVLPGPVEGYASSLIYGVMEVAKAHLSDEGGPRFHANKRYIDVTKRARRQGGRNPSPTFFIGLEATPEADAVPQAARAMRRLLRSLSKDRADLAEQAVIQMPDDDIELEALAGTSRRSRPRLASDVIATIQI
jgi:hypothetical protein